jgi:SAM-dependent methyltransferase
MSGGDQIAATDAVNAQFYDAFPYPPPPASFVFPSDPDFAGAMLCQDIGDWPHTALPQPRDIWVAGCGANQAIGIALNFQRAMVLGTDVSANSLRAGRTIAGQLGLTNLRLIQESLSAQAYDSCFDYVVATGVLHHTADPERILAGLTRSLRRSGILELMVYNRFHRTGPAAYQAAIRLLRGTGRDEPLAAGLAIARTLVDDGAEDSPLTSWLEEYADAPASLLADTFLQPVEHSFTVGELSSMAERCGLRLLAPRPNRLDQHRGAHRWTMAFGDPDLQERYDALPEIARWEVTNLLLLERSPHLWFYLGRADGPLPSTSVLERCESFLATTFAKPRSTQRIAVRRRDGSYDVSPKTLPYTPPREDALVSRLVEFADGTRTMRELLGEIGVVTTLPAVEDLLLRTATSLNPHLLAVDDTAPAACLPQAAASADGRGSG